MLELRPLEDQDIPLVKNWLNKEHVKRWYEIPHLNITINDWMSEINQREDNFKWITYLIATWQKQPIGFCLFYWCSDSDEDFGSLSLENAYGIDYLIGEEDFLNKGLGKNMIALLVEKIFALPDAKIITADIDKENKASEKVLLACGFSLLTGETSRYVLEKKEK